MLRYFLLFSVMVVAPVLSYQNGAPVEACDDMTPQHGAEAKRNNFPYRISLSGTQVRGGQAVQVRIQGNSQYKLKGFMVQARVGNQAVGYFEPNQYVHTINCGNGANNAATHNKIDGDGVEVIEMNWIAPPGLKEQVQFMVTTVKDGGTYWVGQLSDVVQVI